MSNISPLYAHEYAGETRLWPEPHHCISIVSRLNRNPHKDVVAGGCGRDAGEASGQPGHRTPQRGHSLVSVWPECGHRERERPGVRGPGHGWPMYGRAAHCVMSESLCLSSNISKYSLRSRFQNFFPRLNASITEHFIFYVNLEDEK